MLKIDSYNFGSIVIGGKTYTDDIYILPSGEIKERKRSHVFTRGEMEYLFREEPELVIIGKGESAIASLSQEARDFIKEKEVELKEGKTQDVKEEFNKFFSEKKTADIFHLTC